MIFSDMEMQRRVERLQAAMREQELDLVIISSYHGNLYYAGFWMMPMGRFNFTVVPAQGPVAIIAPIMERDRVPAYSWITDMRFYSDAGTSLSGLVQASREWLVERDCALDRVGIEMDVMPVGVLESLKVSLPRSNFTDVSTILMEHRVVKSKRGDRSAAHQWPDFGCRN